MLVALTAALQSMTLADAESLRLKRDQLEKWLEEPYFEEAVIGCFVRVGLGMNHHTGKPTYRMAEIVGA